MPPTPPPITDMNNCIEAYKMNQNGSMRGQTLVGVSVITEMCVFSVQRGRVGHPCPLQPIYIEREIYIDLYRDR